MSLPLINVGLADNDTNADEGRTAFVKTNAYLKWLDRQNAFRAGMVGRGIVGTAGDSMADNAGGAQYNLDVSSSSYSPIERMKALFYDADIVIDNRKYGQAPFGIGCGFAVGGTDVVHLRDVQMPWLREAMANGKLPDLLYLSTFQNETFFAVNSADPKIAIVQACITEMLSWGLPIIMLGIYPHSNKGRYTENAFLRHYVDNVMRNWCANKPGIRYVSVLQALKKCDPTEEGEGLVNWKVGYSNDEIHYNPRAAREIARLLAPAFRSFVRPYSPPCFEAFDYTDTRNKYANYFGASGLMLGTGGLLNGTASANLPAGVNLDYDTTLGYSVTPRIDAVNGERALLLDLGGTSTSAVLAKLSITKNKAFSSGNVEIYARLRKIAVQNLDGEVLSCSRANAGGVGQTVHILPGAVTEDVILRNLRSTGWGAGGGSNADPLKLEFGVPANLPLGGSVAVFCMGLFRTDY